jgi:glycosyltransferase involved in cell wall biosynthesis
MNINANRIVALLGRQDGATDGVADYCASFGRAMAPHGYEVEIVRSEWPELGWRAALKSLRRKAQAWRGCWVLFQFTGLGWSRRGFPLFAPRFLRILQKHGVRCGVVFHEFRPCVGDRLVDRARQFCQQRVLRQLYELAEIAVFTAPLAIVSWLPKSRDKAVFIPIGANCPEPRSGWSDKRIEERSVAVYSVTGGAQALLEVSDIAYAMTRASRAAGRLRLVVFGRGALEAELDLRAGLAGTNVEVETLGLLSPEEVSHTLASCDILLFVRGEISSRRGTAIAGIACGLPIICYSGPETCWPVTEAGILSVPLRDIEGLSAALEKVIADTKLREDLAGRSRKAQAQYFSWSTIAGQFAAALRADPSGK